MTWSLLCLPAVLCAIPLELSLPIATGPLVDAQCNLETVDEANTYQLYEVLKGIAESTFFRLIKVNMDGMCPYWGGPAEEEHACESKTEETAVPMCTLGTDASHTFDPFGTSSPFSSSEGLPMSTASDPIDSSISHAEGIALKAAAATEDCTNEELPTFWVCAA